MKAFTTEDIEKYHPEYFSDIDIHFARFMLELSGADQPELFLASALLSRNTGTGHVCIDLSSQSGKPVVEKELQRDPVFCPDLSMWTKILKSSRVVGAPYDFKPLILDSSSRLYLYRYWEYEQSLAASIKERASAKIQTFNGELLKKNLCRLFSDNEQKLAAFSVVMKNFSVICGGPGTGKSTTVAKILALLIELFNKDITIKLAAPTGKAADRLKAAIKKAKEDHLKSLCLDEVIKAIPDSVSTLHRLLGAGAGSAYFRYNSKNPLTADVVVIDEASMVDLPMMSKLFQATLPETKIIILGDKDQLASVESGAVLGDICTAESIQMFSPGFCMTYRDITNESPPLSCENAPEIYDCITQLRKNYRFGAESGIGMLSIAVNNGEEEPAISLLNDKKYPDISCSPLPRPGSLGSKLRNIILESFGRFIESSGFEEALKRLDLFRILCALRDGPFGVYELNRLVEKILIEHRLIKPAGPWYHGRPIIITRNDYGLKLFNGDLGVLWEDNNGTLRAFFPGQDETYRDFAPGRLPEHETVYAMTIHKSQGSEFEDILMILPEKDFPLLTRELIYTGITRAKKNITIWMNEEVFKSSIKKQVKRASGLKDRLYDK
jgi:exodeoxyribonuclease V alpha subunit